MKYLYFCITLTFLITSFSICPSQTSSASCYDNQKIQLILRFEENQKAMQFTTFLDWKNQKHDSTLFRQNYIWFTRTGAGKELDDADFLAYLGREKEAERIRLSMENDRKKATTQFILGIPLGLGMLIGGTIWYSDLKKDSDSSVPEKGTAIAISIAGVGVITGATLNFINSRHRSPTDHKITSYQALEMADRYNRALKRKCGLEE